MHIFPNGSHPMTATLEMRGDMSVNLMLWISKYLREDPGAHFDLDAALENRVPTEVARIAAIPQEVEEGKQKKKVRRTRIPKKGRKERRERRDEELEHRRNKRRRKGDERRSSRPTKN
eukprot:TRINITY_DN12198_c0_g1_i1.p1 TRINITY_DN12198_c0_g1~~TRINITY_DN12198_c0_g1_i1.p1  ORF type:complete len:118 (+),score=26.93 TRINITY_DN12198_c0_g1_i1:178-531(+)